MCYKTFTTLQTHQIVRDNWHKSCHIQETKKGPRYCPSLEAKVKRFPQQNSHTVWLEPEGYDSGRSILRYTAIAVALTSSPSELIYPNGLSCSLPEDIQEELYRSIPGLENVELVRPAYGVEYDHVDARELKGEGLSFDRTIVVSRRPQLLLRPSVYT